MKNIVRIIIADDQRPARLGLQALISLIPRIEIVGEASNGEEAIALVAAEQPDVVVMDIEMPVMDGLAATQAIKQQWPAVRVVAMTVDPKYRAAAIAAGADTFLLKGADSDVLLNAIINATNLNH